MTDAMSDRRTSAPRSAKPSEAPPGSSEESSSERFEKLPENPPEQPSDERPRPGSPAVLSPARRAPDDDRFLATGTSHPSTGAGQPPAISPGRRRRALAGLADQAFAAGANAANGVVAGILLGPAAYGRYVAVIGIALVTAAICRGFLGEVLLTHTARAAGEEFRDHIRDASATALAVGGLAIAGAVGLWLIGFDLLRDLLWLAPFLPAALLSDAGRYAFLSQRRPQRSMMITGVALLVQLGIVAGLVAGESVTPASLLVAWGVGMLVGAAIAVTLLYVNPLLGKPRHWIATTRHLSAWFVATAALSQTATWGVLYFVGGHLGAADLGGLRMLQMLVLMPVQNFIWALTGMIVPGYSRFAGAGDAEQIRRRTRSLVTGYLGIGCGVLLLVPVGQWLVQLLLPEYAPYRDLMWPLALQATLYLVQSPLNAALRGMQHARRAFFQYAAFAIVIIPASLAGATLFGVVGAAWGMATGAGVGLVAAYLFYRKSLRSLTA